MRLGEPTAQGRHGSAEPFSPTHHAVTPLKETPGKTRNFSPIDGGLPESTSASRLRVGGGYLFNSSARKTASTSAGASSFDVNAFRASISERDEKIARLQKKIVEYKQRAEEAEAMSASAKTAAATSTVEEMTELSAMLNIAHKATLYPGETPSWFKLFRQVDADGSGLISYKEFVDMVRRLLKLSALQMPESRLRGMWRTLDTSGDGVLQSGEFGAFMRLGEDKQSLLMSRASTPQTLLSPMPAMKDGRLIFSSSVRRFRQDSTDGTKSMSAEQTGIYTAKALVVMRETASEEELRTTLEETIAAAWTAGYRASTDRGEHVRRASEMTEKLAEAQATAERLKGKLIEVEVEKSQSTRAAGAMHEELIQRCEALQLRAESAERKAADQHQRAAAAKLALAQLD